MAFNSVAQATKCLKELNEQEVLPGVWLHLGYAERRRTDSWGQKAALTWRERRRLGPERHALPTGSEAEGGAKKAERDESRNTANELRPDQFTWRNRAMSDT